MVGFQEIYMVSIARAGGIEVAPGMRLFPDPDPPLPGILWRGARALVRGAVALAKAMHRARRSPPTTPRDVAAKTPEATDPAPTAAAAPRSDQASADSGNENFQAPRAA